MSRSAINRAIDPLGLSAWAGGTALTVRFGDTNVSSAVRGGKLKEEVNAIPEAELVLDTNDPVVLEIDYTRKVTFAIRRDQSEAKKSFTGSVASVTTQGRCLVIKCITAPSFAEGRLKSLASRRVTAGELVYSIARMAEFEDSRIHIEALEALGWEVFEVVAPLAGVAMSGSSNLSRVVITENNERIRSAATDITRGPIQERFLRATHYAVSYVTARRLADAEELGLSDIDRTIAWYVVRSRAAATRLPRATHSAWSRNQLYWKPERGNILMVRGLATGRSWIREPGLHFESPALEPEQLGGSQNEPPYAVTGSAPYQEALLACARAAVTDDPVIKIVEIWNAIEFYAARTKVGRLFSRAELKMLRKSVPEDLSPEKVRRVSDLIDQLSSVPLMVRIRHRIARDGVPLAPEDWRLLHKLREARNNLAHGRTAAAPSREELTRGLSLIARILLHARPRRPGAPESR